VEQGLRHGEVTLIHLKGLATDPATSVQSEKLRSTSEMVISVAARAVGKLCAMIANRCRVFGVPVRS